MERTIPAGYNNLKDRAKLDEQENMFLRMHVNTCEAQPISRLVSGF